MNNSESHVRDPKSSLQRQSQGASGEPEMLKFWLVFLVLGGCIYAVYEGLFMPSELLGGYLEFLTRSIEQAANGLLGITNTYTLPAEQNLEIELGTLDGARTMVNNAGGLVIVGVLLAAIVAWPGPIGRKLIALIVAAIILCGTVFIQLVSMFFVEVHYPLWSNQFSEYASLIPISVGLMVFYCWVRASDSV